MTIVDEIQFYKVLRERDDGRLTSVMVSGDALVEYEAGKVCHGRWDSKVFVYGSVNSACAFANSYSITVNQPHWLFKVEVDRPSLKHGMNIAEIWHEVYHPDDISEIIKKFWTGEGDALYYVTPTSYATWVTDWVVPMRAVSIFDTLAPHEGRAINYHDRKRVNIGKENTKIYV